MTARSFWMQRGVVPRWQLLGVYLLIVVAAGYAVMQNHALVDRIQQSRADSIRTACREQNERHDFALVVTNRLLARPAVPPRQRFTPAQKKAQEAAIRTWVGALVPQRDCQKLVARTVPSKK